MRLLVVAAGTKLPEWVNAGFTQYAGRLTRDYRLELKEIALGQRSGSAARVGAKQVGAIQVGAKQVGAKQAVAKEGEKMLAAIPSGAYVVALQVGGRNLSSEQLAQFLQARAQEGRDVVFCIGGPEGLAAQVDARADFKWSLSGLTLPHALARVVLAEALYRAVTIIKGHPYHRA